MLVYAFRAEADRHGAYAAWLNEVVAGADELALHDVVLSGMVRIVTNPRIMSDPAPIGRALDFVGHLRSARRGRWVSSNAASWEQFERFAAGDRAITGNLVPDAFLAAVAVAHRCRIATADRGFARFRGLDFFDPAA